MNNAEFYKKELANFLMLSPEMEFDVCLLCEYGNPTPQDDRGICLTKNGYYNACNRAEALEKWFAQEKL